MTAAGSFNVDYVNGTWTESTITADNAPALGTTIAASVPLVTAKRLTETGIRFLEAVIHHRFDRYSSSARSMCSELFQSGGTFGVIEHTVVVFRSPIVDTFNRRREVDLWHPPGRRRLIRVAESLAQVEHPGWGFPVALSLYWLYWILTGSSGPRSVGSSICLTPTLHPIPFLPTTVVTAPPPVFHLLSGRSRS